METRDLRARELIGRLTAEFLEKNSNRFPLITVTNTKLSQDRKKATILISVFPQTEEGAALQFAKRKRSGIREYLDQHGKFPFVPTIDVEIDEGEKNRQRIDELSKSNRQPTTDN